MVVLRAPFTNIFVLFWDLLGLFRSAYGRRLHYFCKSSKHCFSYYSRYYECGWKQHVYNGNQPELKSCQKNAVFTPTKIKKYRKWEVEFHGFDGFTYVEKLEDASIIPILLERIWIIAKACLPTEWNTGRHLVRVSLFFNCKSKLENL